MKLNESDYRENNSHVVVLNVRAQATEGGVVGHQAFLNQLGEGLVHVGGSELFSDSFLTEEHFELVTLGVESKLFDGVDFRILASSFQESVRIFHGLFVEGFVD